MQTLDKKKYYKTYDDLKKDFFHLFCCEIYIPKSEYDKMPEKAVKSLIIRGNYFTFTEDMEKLLNILQGSDKE